VKKEHGMLFSPWKRGMLETKASTLPYLTSQFFLYN
jgi:hypothetical protein